MSLSVRQPIRFNLLIILLLDGGLRGYLLTLEISLWINECVKVRQYSCVGRFLSLKFFFPHLLFNLQLNYEQTIYKIITFLTISDGRWSLTQFQFIGWKRNILWQIHFRLSMAYCGAIQRKKKTKYSFKVKKKSLKWELRPPLLMYMLENKNVI